MIDNDSVAYEYARITQELYEKGNYMAYFALLKGMSYARLESVPGEGHNYIAVINGIHAFQKKKKRNVKEGYEYAIKTVSGWTWMGYLQYCLIH